MQISRIDLDILGQLDEGFTPQKAVVRGCIERTSTGEAYCYARIRQLEAIGLITKSRLDSRNDRFLSLTEQGKEILEAIE